MRDNENKLNNQEKCSHDWQEYKQCCYCGAYENFNQEIITRRTQGNVEDIRQKFIEWWIGCKETNGGTPPLAMQVFHWFDSHVHIFNSLTSPKIHTLEGIIELKEKERKEWAEMCIKKQARIEQLEDRIEQLEAPDF